MVSKEEKADKENAYQNAEHNGIRFCPAGQRKPVREQKRGQRTYYKDTNIQYKIVPAQYKSIGIEKNRNKQGSRQYSEAQGRNDAWVNFFQAQHCKEGVYQHREEQ